MTIDKAFQQVKDELLQAQQNYPTFNTAHEGYAILLEEVEELWEEIKRLTRIHHVKWEWVRGHAGDPLNELADQLSKLGALNGSIDELDTLSIPTPPAEPPELTGVVPKGDWERDFLKSIRDQLRRGRKLSEKQQAVVERMRARGSE